jgi:hypothetical protein
MKIDNCLVTDVDDILSLYQAARELQTQKKMVVWPEFERSFIEKEISEQRQWKLIVDGAFACNWAITFNDIEIWDEKDKNDSIYIHRIANNPTMRGNRYVDNIVEWAKEYAKQKGKSFVRLDTLGHNTGLINHYTSAGFEYLGVFKLDDVSNLPEHYHREPICLLFEIDLSK